MTTVKLIIRSATIFALLSISALPLKSQESWSLKQCIDYGLQHHLSNEIYKGNIEVAKQVARENIAYYMPQLSGDLQFDDNFKKQTQIIESDNSLLPAGTAFQFGAKFTTTASAKVEQAIFDKYLISGFKALKPNNEVAEISFQQNQETIIYNISLAYIQVYVLKQQINLLEENVSKYEKLHAIAKLQAEKGVIKKVDADKILVAMNNTTSQLGVAESNSELVINRLKNSMGLDLGENINLSDSIHLPINSLSEKINEAFDVNNKTETQLQRRNLLLLKVQQNRVSAGYYPKLSFYANYSAQAFNNEIGNAFNKWYDYSSLGLKLKIPIFDGLQKGAQIRQAKINLQNAQYNLKLNEAGMQLQYQNATAQVKKAQANLESTEMNVGLARDIFDVVTTQYKEGVASLSDLLNTETAYKEAQSNYITSLLGYYSAVVELEKAKGTLQSFYQNL